VGGNVWRLRIVGRKNGPEAGNIRGSQIYLMRGKRRDMLFTEAAGDPDSKARDLRRLLLEVSKNTSAPADIAPSQA